MSFKCFECGSIFDEPRAVEESRGEFWGVPVSETMYYCPCCGSDDYDEVEVDEYGEVVE